MAEENKNIIFPVVRIVPVDKQNLSGREQFYFLRQYARQAVLCSSEKMGMEFSLFEKDGDGVPLPENGCYWSLSHKPAYVAGVTASQPVGIDLEYIRPVKPALFKKVADEREWQLADKISDIFFYRFWTAKEAVLKANGTGLRDMSQCKIDQIVDGTRIMVAFRGKTWTVEHVFFDTHVASVTMEDYTVQWDLPPGLKI
jgi:4'-phosphopantetheinyl transferase